MGLNVGCDNPTHIQSDPFSALPGGGGYSSDQDTQMALLKKTALRHPRELHPRMGQPGTSMTKPNPKYGEIHPTELRLNTGQWCLVGWGQPYPGLG